MAKKEKLGAESERIIHRRWEKLLHEHFTSPNTFQQGQFHVRGLQNSPNDLGITFENIETKFLSKKIIQVELAVILTILRGFLSHIQKRRWS